MHESQVLLSHLPPAELALEMRQDIGSPSDQKDAAGIAVQAVHDPWPLWIHAGLCDIRILSPQSRYQSFSSMAPCAMHHQPRRLVDHDDGIILVKDG